MWKNTEAPQIRPVSIKLETYTGDPVEVIGAALVRVKYSTSDKVLKCPLLWSKGILGRGWLEQIRLRWMEIKSTTLVRCNTSKQKKHCTATREENIAAGVQQTWGSVQGGAWHTGRYHKCEGQPCSAFLWSPVYPLRLVGKSGWRNRQTVERWNNHTSEIVRIDSWLIRAAW